VGPSHLKHPFAFISGAIGRENVGLRVLGMSAPTRE
jgi:hypothetical protein